MYNIKLQASNKLKWVTEVMQVEIDWQISPFYSFVNPTDISEHLEHWILGYTLNNALLLPSHFLAPSVLLVFHDYACSLYCWCSTSTSSWETLVQPSLWTWYRLTCPPL